MKKVIKLFGLALLAGTIGCSSGTTEKTAVEKFDDAVEKVSSKRKYYSYEIEASTPFRAAKKMMNTTYADYVTAVTFDEEGQAVLLGVVVPDGMTHEVMNNPHGYLWREMKEACIDVTDTIGEAFQDSGYDVSVGFIQYSDLDGETPILITLNGEVVYDVTTAGK